jgi:dTDP-4-dehydrorhamnose 3,5-epimerase-like enzyme
MELPGIAISFNNPTDFPVLDTETGVSGVHEITLPVITDDRGDLTFVESGTHVPFTIRRVYYLYNVPTSKARGGHAHKQLKQVIFALSGSFRITLEDGRNKTTYVLCDPSRGLLIDGLVWREMDQFSEGAICMVLASQPFDDDDYIRDYDMFLQAAGLAQ